VGQAKHKGRDLLIVGSFIFGFLNRALQFPKRFGLSVADPDVVHAKALSNVRAVFVQMVDSFGLLGGAEQMNLMSCKFVLTQIPRVMAFCESVFYRRGSAPIGAQVQVAPVAAKELFEAQSVIFNIRNPSAKKAASPDAVKKKSATMVLGSESPPPLDKSRSGTVFKNLFGGLKSPRGEHKETAKEKDAKEKEAKEKSGGLSPSKSPRNESGGTFSKKSELPAELAAALLTANRGKTVSVAEAQQIMKSPRTEEKERAALAAPTRGPSKAVPAQGTFSIPVAASPKMGTRTQQKEGAVASPVAPSRKAEPLVVVPVVAAAAAAPPPAAKGSEKLQMSIPEFGLGIEQFALPVWKVGDFVCAQWDEDRCWYKARIEERVDEDRYRVTFVEYGNSCICDNATQIVELPDEDSTEKILSDVFDAEALVREMSGQFGATFDHAEMSRKIQEEDAKSIVEVLDEDGEKVVSHVDLLQALDFSLASEGGAKSKDVKKDGVKVDEAKKRRDEEVKALREAETKAAELLAETESAILNKQTVIPTLPAKPRVSNRPTVADAVVVVAESVPVVIQHHQQKPLKQSSEDPANLLEFLEKIELADTLPVFEERKLTWMSLKLADADDLAELGIPKKILQKVIEGLMKIPGTVVFKTGGAQAQEMDYEHMQTLPILPVDPPLMSNKVEYKNYMRLKYEHQKRAGIHT
jgi:hypothetical protein